MQIEPEAVPLVVGAKNAGVTALVALLVLLVTGYVRREGSFDFLYWCYDSRQRLLTGLVIVVVFTLITILVPDVTPLLAVIGFDPSAQAPIGFGLALAGFLVVQRREDEK